MLFRHLLLSVQTLFQTVELLLTVSWAVFSPQHAGSELAMVCGTCSLNICRRCPRLGSALPPLRARRRSRVLSSHCCLVQGVRPTLQHRGRAGQPEDGKMNRKNTQPQTKQHWMAPSHAALLIWKWEVWRNFGRREHNLSNLPSTP